MRRLNARRIYSAAVLAEGLAQGVVRDRVLRDGRAVSLVDVHVTRDLQLARCFWEPHHEDDFEPHRLERLQASLERRRGVLRSHVNSYLRQRIAAQLDFCCVHGASPDQRSLTLEETFARLREEAQAPERSGD